MTTNHYTNIAAMTALTKASLTNNQQVIVGGYTSIGDGGGGTFYWDSASSETANGGTAFAANEGGTGRWKRMFSGAVNVRWFGAKGDGSTDDRGTIQNVITAALGGGLTVYVPVGTYRIASALSLPNNLIMTGEDRTQTVIKADNNTYAR